MSNDNEVKFIDVAPGDPLVQLLAAEMSERLVRDFGLGNAIGLLTAALFDACMAVLHQPSPSPGLNIESIHRLIQHVDGRLQEHAICAYNNMVRSAGEVDENYRSTCTVGNETSTDPTGLDGMSDSPTTRLRH